MACEQRVREARDSVVSKVLLQVPCKRGVEGPRGALGQFRVRLCDYVLSVMPVEVEGLNQDDS